MVTGAEILEKFPESCIGGYATNGMYFLDMIEAIQRLFHAIKKVVTYCFLIGSGDIGQIVFGFRIITQKIFKGGLETGKTEVQGLLSSERERERISPGIPPVCRPGKAGTAGIGKSENTGSFIERFACRIVTCATNQFAACM